MNHGDSLRDQAVPAPFQILFSVKQAACALGISVRTTQSLISTKALPARRIGRRVLIHRKDLEHFARADHAHVGGE